MELEANDGVFVSFVVSGAVSKLCDPASCGAVCRARVHEPIDHHHADQGARVTVHVLQQHVVVTVVMVNQTCARTSRASSGFSLEVANVA